MGNKLVSVAIITYNHEHYIKECIESIVAQIVDFDYEIVIGQDCSTDATHAVCLHYAQLYPDLIRYNQRTRNLGMMGNWMATIKECTSKYIALCEGDDYWTDPYKLQKQVDFLEANEDYAICAHVVQEKNEFTNELRLFPDIKMPKPLQIEDYIFINHTGTCSLLYVSKYFREVPEWTKKVGFADLSVVLSILYTSQKKLWVLPNAMGVYRINEGGIHGSLKNTNMSLIKAYQMHITFITVVYQDLFHRKNYTKEVYLKLIDTYKKLSDYSSNSDRKLHYKFHFNYLRYRLWFKLYTIFKLKLPI